MAYPCYFCHVKKFILPFSIILLGLWMVLQPSCTPVTKDKTLSHEDSLLQKVKEYLDWEGQNGFSGVVLVQFGKAPLLIKSYGYANRELGIPNAPDEVFDIGSLVKQFTAAAILKLEMQGKLSVTDSVGKYFKGLSPEKQCITIHELLIHTSGLPFKSGSDYEPSSKEELIVNFKEVSLVSAPGKAYNYSHFGYSLLGAIIESASGMTYENYLRENLFLPSGMKSTGYILPDWEDKKIAHGYRNCRDWGRPMDLNWLDNGPNWNVRASCAMLSNALDLYAWHKALKGDDILDAKAKEKYYHPYLTKEMYKGVNYAYGWKVLTSRRGTYAYAHNGGNGRFYSDFLRYLTDDVTILVLSNRFRHGDPSMSYEIASCIFTPNHKAEIHGQLTECLDSLPNNRTGQIAKQFLHRITTSEQNLSFAEVKPLLASHLIKKYPEKRLNSFFHFLRNHLAGADITQVKITDSRIVELNLSGDHNQKKLFLRLILDENEDYKIRGIMYDDNYGNR